ncbi:hydroxyacid dehydrogenase [Enterovirga rhinocerotis]|uniref:D-3-phosphoglycerate dehydrogenase n=1 Tax=Enterovirga rhinocerotis TaxID=1339210 RepID=A0A4R7BW09_9HYPH|nr:hydroxyacid dehydrogenase [Enterovirga rhinocerotis]TDR90068.1 D-3-phosphoglycerate dehydrogenase [Enterovirga rhinocerotis]
MQPRLAYFENWIDPEGPRRVERSGGIDLLRLSYDAPEDENWAALATAHGYQIAPRSELKEPWFGTAALLARCPSLLAISSTGAGYDMVDVEACTAAGVIVCNQSGTNDEAVAEHALGLMLCLSKQIVQSDRALRRQAGIDRFAFTGRDLLGKTVGIVGLGRIGARLAELCGTLFAMRVLAVDPYLSAAEIEARGAVKADLAEMLREADFVSVNCPRSAETFGMFGADAFAAMKPTAYFVTTARGGIHDEAALAEALRAGRIAGAGLDVFLTEPPGPDHPLLAFDNVVASPHIAGVTEEAVRNMATAAAEQWQDILAGRAPPRLVNPEAWPLYARRFEAVFGRSPATP